LKAQRYRCETSCERKDFKIFYGEHFGGEGLNSQRRKNTVKTEKTRNVRCPHGWKQEPPQGGNLKGNIARRRGEKPSAGKKTSQAEKHTSGGRRKVLLIKAFRPMKKNPARSRTLVD